MRAEAQIKELVRKDGFLYTKDVVTVGIRKEKLKELLEEGLLMQEARGIYSFSDQMTDEFTLIQVRCRKGIYSHETALFFHGLTDQPRLQIAVTIPAGYCVNRIKEDFQHITFYRIKGSLWQVRIMERISPQGGAIYFKDKERDSKRLMEYARQFGIAERTTVDIDTTVKGLQMEEAEIRKAVENFLWRLDNAI